MDSIGECQEVTEASYRDIETVACQLGAKVNKIERELQRESSACQTEDIKTFLNVFNKFYQVMN